MPTMLRRQIDGQWTSCSTQAKREYPPPRRRRERYVFAGNPELRLALNEDLVVGKSNAGSSFGSVVLDVSLCLLLGVLPPPSPPLSPGMRGVCFGVGGGKIGAGRAARRVKGSVVCVLLPITCVRATTSACKLSRTQVWQPSRSERSHVCSVDRLGTCDASYARELVPVLFHGGS